MARAGVWSRTRSRRSQAATGCRAGQGGQSAQKKLANQRRGLDLSRAAPAQLAVPPAPACPLLRSRPPRRRPRLPFRVSSAFTHRGMGSLVRVPAVPRPEAAAPPAGTDRVSP